MAESTTLERNLFPVGEICDPVVDRGPARCRAKGCRGLLWTRGKGRNLAIDARRKYGGFVCGPTNPSSAELLCISCEHPATSVWTTAVERAGYSIKRCVGRMEAKAVLSKMPIDLIIIGPTLPIEEQTDLTFSIKKSHPHILTVMLCMHGQPADLFVDAVVDDTEDTEYLVQTIHRLTTSSNKLRR